jgi:sec-independent protein translocase protein TatB
MFDIGFSELLVIGLVALIVLGPKRLPEVARAAGRWTAKIRRFVADVKQDFDRELRNAELSELHKLKQELDETRRVMEDTSGKLFEQIQAVPASVAAPATATYNTIAPLSEPAPPAVTAAGAKRPAARQNPPRKSVPASRRHGRSERVSRTKRR